MTLRLRRLPRRPREDDNVLPLINVVFLLVIFFLLAGRIGVEQSDVVPPRSASQDLLAAGQPLLLVYGDGRFALDGRIVEDEALREALAGLAADELDQAWQIRASAEAEASRVLTAMALLRDAGVESARLATMRTGP